VVMAIERGCLQDLVFDNRALASHRALAALLGVVLRLPPIKQAMASRQLQSRYLARLIERREGAGLQRDAPEGGVGTVFSGSRSRPTSFHPPSTRLK